MLSSSSDTHIFLLTLSLSAAWYAFHYSTISHLENSNDDNSKNEMKETLSLFLSKYFLILYVIMQIVIIFHSWSIVDKMLRTWKMHIIKKKRWMFLPVWQSEENKNSRAPLPNVI